MARQKQNDADGPQKISLPLDSEGGIDWDRIRGSQRDIFLKAVENDVTTLEHIGMAHTGTAVDGEDGEAVDLGITQDDVHEALDELFKAESMIFRIAAAKFMKHPLLRDREGKQIPMIVREDIATAAFKLSDKDHKVLDKRVFRQVQRVPIPEWMKKHLDLWMIGIYLGKSTLTNVQKALRQQIELDLRAAMQAQARNNTDPKSNPRPDSDFRPPAPVAPNEAPDMPGESLDSEAAMADTMSGGLPNIPESPLV